jgi:hypothetical protein
MHDMNAIKAPKEISTSARLKFKSNQKGNGIQSITWPRRIRSMRFDNAPPDMTERPKRMREFMSAKKRTQRRITHEIPERIRVKTGEPPKIPKAAPAL